MPLRLCMRESNGLSSFALKAKDGGESEDAVQEEVCTGGGKATNEEAG